MIWLNSDLRPLGVELLSWVVDWCYPGILSCRKSSGTDGEDKGSCSKSALFKEAATFTAVGFWMIDNIFVVAWVAPLASAWSY